MVTERVQRNCIFKWPHYFLCP